MIMKDIVIWDETLRDGEQAPGISFSLDQKLQLAKLLDKAGIGIIDAGFPSVSKIEQQTIQEILKLNLRATVGATIRTNKDDINLAKSIGLKSVFMFAPTSEVQIKHKFNRTPEDFFKEVVDMFEYAISKGLDITFISEDTSRSSLAQIKPLFNELENLGINKIMITDTVGIMYPGLISQLVHDIRSICKPDTQLGIHCHNDFGLATANTLAAIEAGVTLPTLTVNGIGERSGNASFEETVLALESLYKVNTSIDLKMITEISKIVEKFSGIPIPLNKPVVGHNAFRHESGIHVNALLKEPKTYEAFSPGLINRKHEYVLGKHSGRALIRDIMSKNNISDETILEEILDNVKSLKEQNEIKKEMLKDIYAYYEKVSGLSEQNLLEKMYKIRKVCVTK